MCAISELQRSKTVSDHSANPAILGRRIFGEKDTRANCLKYY